MSRMLTSFAEAGRVLGADASNVERRAVAEHDVGIDRIQGSGAAHRLRNLTPHVDARVSLSDPVEKPLNHQSVEQGGAGVSIQGEQPGGLREREAEPGHFQILGSRAGLQRGYERRLDLDWLCHGGCSLTNAHPDGAPRLAAE